MTAMEAITTTRRARRPSVASLLGGTLIGTLLIVIGLTLAYVAFATPLLILALPLGRPDAGGMAVGMAVWAIALVAPSALVLVGTARLARILGAVRPRRSARSGVLRGLNGLSDDVTVASGLVLPDGRGLSHLLLGPFGAAVVRELPPAAATRFRGDRWELRTPRGWIALENPLERAVRDAERVRRWMARDDADFVVKVHAVVVGPDPQIARTSSCAVVSPEQLAGWVGSLPPQRSLTESRRRLILEIARDAAH